MKFFVPIALLAAVAAASAAPSSMEDQYGHGILIARAGSSGQRTIDKSGDFKNADGKTFPKTNLDSSTPNWGSNSHKANDVPPPYSANPVAGGGAPQKGQSPPSWSQSQQMQL